MILVLQPKDRFMLYRRLMGLTDDCYGEIIQQEDDEIWISDRVVTYKPVKPDLYRSSHGGLASRSWRISMR